MKRICISALIALLIIGIGMFINYRAFQQDHHLKYSIKHHGGEITIEHGFGLQAVHIYAMSPEENDSHTLRFDPISFLVFLLGITVIVYVLSWIAALFNKRRI